MNTDIKESANIYPLSSKKTFLHYYKELWTNNSLQENYTGQQIVTDVMLLR